MAALPATVLSVSLLASTAALCAGPADRVLDDWTDEYDMHFRKYAKRYFGPSFDWRWFKAQGVAESNLKPEVRSQAGAVGIMQILPSTFEEIQRQNTHFSDISEPRWNIAAGIFYDRTIYKKWGAKIPSVDRMFLTLASYNAGYGTMLKARKKAAKQGDSEHRWDTIAPFAPGETRSYVSRIGQLMGH